MAEELRITSKIGLLSGVLSAGALSVPWHQRYYDWKEEHVEDLLYDLQTAHESDQSTYFLGSIMLVGEIERGNRKWDINDGQQRLITFSMLLALLVRSFVKRRQQDKDQGREATGVRYLFQIEEGETLSLAEASHRALRIAPPRNDEARFRQILCGQDVGTNGKLTGAWTVIRRFVDPLGAEKAASFFDFLLQRVEVAILNVPVGMDANSIFEALNGRGKELSDLDLMRNYLYAYFAEGRYSDQREIIHNSLERSLEILGVGAGSSGKAEEYFRCFFQCEYGFINKNRFYKEAKKQLPDRSDSQAASGRVSRLVERMTEGSCVELFRTITSSSVNTNLLEQFKRPGRKPKRGLDAFLRELKAYKVSHPLLFALMRRLILEEDAELKREILGDVFRSIKNLNAFVMRTAFWASKFEPSKFEALFANHAKRISAASGLDDLDIYDFLLENDEHEVMSDEVFIAKMEGVTMTDISKARRYLFGICMMQQQGQSLFRDTLEKRFTVEHVLPKSEQHWENWMGFSNVEPSKYVNRIGNMVLLSEDENSGGAKFNSSFEEKRKIFKSSPLQIAKDTTDFDEWTPDVVDSRSTYLARQATEVWCFDDSAREYI